MAFYMAMGGGGESINYIAPPYDSTQTYNKEDVVIYGGKTYICNDDSVTGDFDTSKWDFQYLEGLTELNSNLGELTSVGSATLIEGTYFDAVVGDYYLLAKNTGVNQESCATSGAERIGFIKTNLANGRWALAELVKATSTKITYNDGLYYLRIVR